MKVDVIIPSLGKSHAFDALKSLKHLPFGIRLHLVTEGNSWPKAINIGLSESTGDVLLMDDDVRILPDTFTDLNIYYDKADIFGFKLLFEDGRIQHAGGFSRDGCLGHIGFGQYKGFDVPYYTCHNTASLLYIKRHVVEKLMGMSMDFKGVQFEDVDFSFRALKEGFKILYIPNKALHLESQTKKESPEFNERMFENYNALRKRYFTDMSFLMEVEKYPKQYGKYPLP